MDDLLASLVANMRMPNEDDDADTKNREENVKLPRREQLRMSITPKESHKKLRRGYFPKDYHDKVLVMSSQPMKTDRMRTFIFGTINAKYDEEMWNYDLHEFGERFVLDMDDNHTVYKIKMRPADEQGIFLDSENAIAEIYKAITVLNSVGAGEPIRIVHLGFAESGFFFQGVEFLLKRWLPGTEHKKVVHFLTTGDSESRMYENFCKSLVLRNFCTEIEFFNCQDYFPFGEYSFSHK